MDTLDKINDLLVDEAILKSKGDKKLKELYLKEASFIMKVLQSLEIFKN